MAVNITKLWGNAMFMTLTIDAKLLYLYLISNPSINNVGVISIVPDVSSRQLGISIDNFRKASKELIDKKYIYIKNIDGVIYFIVPSHFSTIPKTEGLIEKVKSDLKSIPSELKEFLKSIGISSNAKEINLKKPTIEEINQFCIDSGYMVNAEDFYNFYEKISTDRGTTNYWVDSKGRIVKDWKMKMKKVWFKPENKIIIPDNAPKGFEFLYVEINGIKYFVDYWRDGKPHSKHFIANKELKKEYEKRKANS